ncbi:hypothetical protein HK102_012624, partial [Quaeritorhiza haematococci]
MEDVPATTTTTPSDLAPALTPSSSSKPGFRAPTTSISPSLPLAPSSSSKSSSPTTPHPPLAPTVPLINVQGPRGGTFLPVEVPPHLM